MGGMRSRRAAAWLLAMPLMVAGSQVAHILAFRWVYPEAHVRFAALLATGHGYMLGSPAFWPLLLGALGGMELIALLWTIGCELRRTRHCSVPAWAFGMMPPVGFAVQEFLERWLAGVSFPWQVVMEPTFRVGLLLQLPFALVAYLATRMLLRVAQTVGRVLREPDVLAPVLFCRCWAVCAAQPLRGAVLAALHAGRGPPALVLSR
jgi:hypothetical protein